MKSQLLINICLYIESTIQYKARVPAYIERFCVCEGKLSYQLLFSSIFIELKIEHGR